MATRSYIAYKRKDGEYVVSYCHNDGYIEGVGATLYKNYRTLAQVKTLVDQGQMSYLGQYCTKPAGHSYNNPVKDYTIYYGRDRGETDTEPMIVDSLDDLGNSYHYCYMGGKWMVKQRYGDNMWVPLSKHFVRKQNPTIRSFLGRKHSYKEVFDYVREKVNAQGKASVIGGSCAFRGADGCKCAVGFLITDEDLGKVPSQYNKTGFTSLIQYSGIDIKIDSDTKKAKLAFISQLQRAHDEAAYDGHNGYYTKLNSDHEFLIMFNKNMDAVALAYEL